jgi:hypothetical protein
MPDRARRDAGDLPGYPPTTRSRERLLPALMILAWSSRASRRQPWTARRHLRPRHVYARVRHLHGRPLLLTIDWMDEAGRADGSSGSGSEHRRRVPDRELGRDRNHAFPATSGFARWQRRHQRSVHRPRPGRLACGSRLAAVFLISVRSGSSGRLVARAARVRATLAPDRLVGATSAAGSCC